MNQLDRIPFLVIGGGLGGLATALGLSRKGYPVHVLEKAHEFGEIGAGIQKASATGQIRTIGAPRTNWKRILLRHTRA